MNTLSLAPNCDHAPTLLNSESTINPFGAEIVCEPEGFSFRDPATSTGVRRLSPRIRFDSAWHVVTYETATAGDAAIEATGRAGAIALTTRIEMVDGLNAVTVKHTLKNIATVPVTLREAATGQWSKGAGVLSGKGNGLGWDLRFCHSDNVRTEQFPYCTMDYPYFRMLPVGRVTLGAGEDQPVPAIYFRDQASRRGLVIGAASQTLNDTTFTFRRAPFVQDGMFAEFAIQHELTQTDGIQLSSGGSLELDGLLIQLTGDIHPQDAYNEYLDFLAARHEFRGARTPLLEQALHCTWNYGIFSDQRESELLKTARYIAANLPNIRFFLLDAGYCNAPSGSDPLQQNFLDRFYLDPDASVDKEKFPRGIRAFSDAIRDLGLRPGLWWSPTVSTHSQLYADHPDWYLRNLQGDLYRTGEGQGFLDYSQPPVRAFLDQALSIVLGAWGMDATKMDFWSQNFEDRDARLRQPNVTAVQCRRMLFEIIRKHLPADGILMTCVATGMGNPFIGQWADTYRNTVDIGAGCWQEQVNNCFWALPTLGLKGRQSFLLNNDSAGILPEYPDRENYFRLTWSFIHMGMIETGGRIETWPEHFVRALRKLTDRCDRGHRCLCPDDHAFTGIPLPEVLYVNYPPGSRTARAGIAQTVALFNWSDEPRLVSVRRDKLGHDRPVIAENFWTEERETLSDEFMVRRLEGRSAEMYDIRR